MTPMHRLMQIAYMRERLPDASVQRRIDHVLVHEGACACYDMVKELWEAAGRDD